MPTQKTKSQLVQPALQQQFNAGAPQPGQLIPGQPSPDQPSPAAKPFVKWVGGKRSILKTIIQYLPKAFESYVEPFVGGGALFFATQCKHSALSDVNARLITAYQAVRDDVNSVIQELKQHQQRHNKPYYLRMRALMTEKQPAPQLAASLIYLNKTCYNGLYRVNQRGGFNVPMGSYLNPSILDEANLVRCSEALQAVHFSCHSFAETPLKKNAFYYLDPPYHQAYSQYDSAGFGEQQQQELAAFCNAIDGAGAYFMLSNNDTALVRKLYSKYHLETVSALRAVACKAEQRGRVQELLIRNYT